MKVQTFYDEVFEVEVHLVIGCEPLLFSDYVHKTLQQVYAVPAEFKGICLSSTRHIVIGLVKWEGSASDISILSHETMHATCFTLRDRGIKFSRGTEEMYCYLQDSLLRRSLHALGVE